MFRQIIRFLACSLFCLTITSTISFANELNEHHTPEKINVLDTQLKEKIEYYRRLYPEIAFVIMQGEDIDGEMTSLDFVLGSQPESLDYEHTPELREDLMFVSTERIWIMLQNKLPSSSLFKADTPLGWQEHVCVLTINPLEIAADAIHATGHLLDLPQKFIENIPEDMQLSANDYLSICY